VTAAERLRILGFPVQGDSFVRDDSEIAGAARRCYRTTTRCGARARCGGVGSVRFPFVQRRLGDEVRWLLGWCAASAGPVKGVALVAAEWLARAMFRVLVEVLGGNLLAF